MSRRTLAVIAIAVLAAGTALLVPRLLRTPHTDEELVRALFEDAAHAAEERRVSDAVAGVSERFVTASGIDRQGVKQLVAFNVMRGQWVSISVAGVASRIEGDRARANVDVVLARGAKGGSLASLLPGEASVYRFDCRLERESAGWRIVGGSWRAIELAEALDGPPAPGP